MSFRFLKKKNRLRVTAFLTAIFFVGTTFSGQGTLWARIPAAPLYGAENPRPATGPWRDFLPEIPKDLGVFEAYQPPLPDFKSPFIIHIRDVHADPGAQKKIRDLLKWIHNETARGARQPLVIGLEGAADTIHPEYLDFFPQYPEVNEEIVRNLLSKGELHGVELFAWESYREQKALPVSIVGVEDPGLYRENIAAYRYLLSRRDDIGALLQPFRRELERMQSRVLSPELWEFFRERQRRKHGRYERGTASPQLAAWVRYLEQTVREELDIDLTQPFEQVRFPNLVRLRVIQRLANEKDREAAAREKETALRALRQKAGLGEERQFFDQLENLSEGPEARRVVEKVWEFSSDNGINLAAYPNYGYQLTGIVLRSELEAGGLFGEMKVLEDWLVMNWAKSEKEKAVIQKLEDLELAEKLLKLEWTPDDYFRYQERGERGLGGFFALTGIESGTLHELRALIRRALSFYQMALERDKVMLEQLLSGLEGSRGGKDDLPPVAVLVTGGFHTPGLEALMKKRELPYAVIRPNLETPGDGGLYHKVMRGDHADVSSYFGVQALNKQEAVFFKALVEIAGPKLWQRYGVPHSQIGCEIAQAVNRHPVLGRRLQARSEEAGEGSRAAFRARAGEQVPSGSQVPVLSFEAFTANPPVLTTKASSYVDLPPVERGAGEHGYPSAPGVLEVLFHPEGVRMTARSLSGSIRSEMRADSLWARGKAPFPSYQDPSINLDFTVANTAGEISEALKVANALYQIKQIQKNFPDQHNLKPDTVIFVAKHRQTQHTVATISMIFNDEENGLRSGGGKSEAGSEGGYVQRWIAAQPPGSVAEVSMFSNFVDTYEKIVFDGKGTDKRGKGSNLVVMRNLFWLVYSYATLLPPEQSPRYLLATVNPTYGFKDPAILESGSLEEIRKAFKGPYKIMGFELLAEKAGDVYWEAGSLPAISLILDTRDPAVQKRFERLFGKQEGDPQQDIIRLWTRYHLQDNEAKITEIIKEDLSEEGKYDSVSMDRAREFLGFPKKGDGPRSELREMFFPRNPEKAATSFTSRSFIEKMSAYFSSNPRLSPLSVEVSRRLLSGVYDTSKAVSEVTGVAEEEAMALIGAQVLGYEPENANRHGEILELAEKVFGEEIAAILFSQTAELPLLQSPRLVSLEKIRDERNQLAIGIALRAQESNSFLFYVTPGEGEDLEKVKDEVREIERGVLAQAGVSFARRLSIRVLETRSVEGARKQVLKDVLSGRYDAARPVIMDYKNEDNYLEGFPWGTRNRSGHTLARVRIDDQLSVGEALLLMPAVSLGQNVVNMLQALEAKGISVDGLQAKISEFIKAYQRMASAA